MNKLFSAFILSCLILLTGCETLVVNENAVVVNAVRETEPVISTDDAADDPAIWIHPVDVSKSLILGTDKRRGLMVYNLDGELVDALERGRLNNVDLRTGVLIDSRHQTLAVATNRTHFTIDVFSITDEGEVSLLHAIPVELTDPYGICMYRDGNTAHVFANSKDGVYQQWVINPHGSYEPELVGSYQLDSQPEGCSADDASGQLYVGEEAAGIWTMPADINRFNEKIMLDVTGEGRVTADVEGMEVYRSEDSLLLVVSSQGDNSYAVYDLADNNRFIGSFRVADHLETGVDGSEETDGLTVTSVRLGDEFPEGLLVVQDGFNRLPVDTQNFKLVSWKDVREALAAGL